MRNAEFRKGRVGNLEKETVSDVRWQGTKNRGQKKIIGDFGLVGQHHPTRNAQLTEMDQTL